MSGGSFRDKTCSVSELQAFLTVLEAQVKRRRPEEDMAVTLGG